MRGKLLRLGMVLAAGLGVMHDAWSLDSFLQAYQAALRADRQYLAAEAQHRAVLEKVPQARAGLLPTISASVNRTNYDAQVMYRDPRFFGIDRQYLVNGWTVTLNQPLFRMANFLQYGRAQLQAEQSYVQLEVARKDLLVRFVRAWLDWQLALRGLEAAEAARKHLELVWGQARTAADLKLMTVQDKLDAEARYRKAAADAEVAKGELKAKAAALAKIVGGIPPAQNAAFAEALPPVQGEVDAWVGQAKELNAQVRAQMLQLAILEKDVDAARAGHLPTLNLVANKAHTFNSGSTSIVDGASANTQNQVSIGLQLEIPIFSGGLINSKTDEAIAMRDRVREELENARDTAAVDVQTYYYKAKAGLSKIEAAAKRIEASEALLAAATTGRALNVRLELDVMGAQSALSAARRDLFSAQAETMVAVIQLRQASGELNDEDVGIWAKLLSGAASEEVSARGKS